MARFEKEDFENADVNMASTVEFNKLLKFIHFYNKEKALNPQGAILDEVAFATDVCNKAGFIGGTALAGAYLKRAKTLNQRTGSYSVPDASQEKQLCTDFREYANAKIDAKKKDLDDKEKEVEKEEKYAQEYDIKAKEVGSARRSVWGPFAKWGAIGLAGTIVLTAILPAVAGITALGGLFSTGFTGLATLATGLIGGFQGFGGRYSAYKKAKNDLARSRRPKLAELEAEKEAIENELKNLESEFKNKDSAMSNLNVMNAEDQAEIRTKIQEIYNEVVAQNKDYVDNGKYITSGIGKGESDRVHAEMDRLVQELNALMLDPNVDAQKLKEAQDKKAQADSYNVAEIKNTADETVAKITANEAIINNFVSTLPDSIKNDANINNKVNGVLTQISGFNDTNKVLHENDTQKQLEQAERAIKKEVILLNADLAKSWIKENGSLNDGNPKKAEYDAIAKAIGDGGSYQNHLKNNNNILADPTKSEAEKERAQREVDKVGTLTSLLLIKARLYRALEESNAHTIRGKFKDINGIKVPQSDFLKSINGEIDRVNGAFEAFRDAGTDPEFGVLAQEVSEIETNLANQIAKFEEEKGASAISMADRQRKLRKIIDEINVIKNAENTIKSGSYSAKFDNIFDSTIKAEFEEFFNGAKDTSYQKQIWKLTDASTFDADADAIIADAKAKRLEIIGKVNTNLGNIQNNAKPDQKKIDAKSKIDNLRVALENAKNSVNTMSGGHYSTELGNIFTPAIEDKIKLFTETESGSYQQQIEGAADEASIDAIVKTATIEKNNILNEVNANLGKLQKDVMQLVQKKINAKSKIDNIYNEIEEAEKEIPIDYLDQIFNGDVETILAGFDTKNTNSYYSQIDKLTDASTFETDAQKIIKDAEQTKNNAIQKIDENKNALLNSKRTEAKNEIQDAPKTFEQMYNDFMDKNIGCFASNYQNGYISLANKLESEVRTVSAYVDGITDISDLDKLDAVVRSFYTYFEDLKSELNKVGEDAKAMQELYDSWFKNDVNVNSKRNTLENKLREIQGISPENINGALQYFDDAIIEIKNRIDERIDKLTLDDLRSALNDENFNLLITQIVDRVNQQIGKEIPGDGETPGLEPAKNPENHTTGETGIIPITRQRGEVSLQGSPEKTGENPEKGAEEKEEAEVSAFIKEINDAKKITTVFNFGSIEKIEGTIAEIVNKYQSSGETAKVKAIESLKKQIMESDKDERAKRDALKDLSIRLKKIEKQNVKNNSSEAEKEAEERAVKEAEEREKAEKEAEERERAEREAKERAEKEKKEAEEKARKEAEEKARKEAEEKARKEAEEKARKEAEEKARKEAEARENAEVSAFIKEINDAKKITTVFNFGSIEKIEGAIAEIVNNYQSNGETAKVKAIERIKKQIMESNKDERAKRDALKDLSIKLKEIEKQNAKNNSSEAGDDEPQM